MDVRTEDDEVGVRIVDRADDRVDLVVRRVFGDPSLQNIHISGVFRTSDQQTFLQMLQQGWAIRARRVGDKQIVLSR